MSKLRTLLLQHLDPLWHDLVEAVESANAEIVLPALQELESIRTINQHTSDRVLEDSLRMLGFNLPQDVMQFSKDRLRGAFRMFDTYVEQCGCRSAIELIAFLLDQPVRVTYLWTTDYIQFYDSAYGNSITNMGEMYPTTKVNIATDLQSLTAKLNMTLDPRLVPYVRRRLLKYMAEQDVDALIGSNVDTVPTDPDLLLLIAEARIVELYYEYAPIEDVVEGMAQLVSQSYSGKMRIRLVEDSIDHYVPKSKRVLVLECLGTNRVYSGSKLPVYLRVVYDDGSEITVVPKTVEKRSGTAEISYSSGVVTFGKVSAEDAVVLRLYWAQGYVDTTILVSITQLRLGYDSVYIQGTDSAVEQTQHKFTLMGMRGAQILPVEDQENVKWSVTRGVFTGSTLVLGDFLVPATVQVLARYVDGQKAVHDVAHSIAVSPAPRAKTPVRLEVLVNSIAGTQYLSQGVAYPMECRCYYNDGTDAAVAADIQLLSNAVTMTPERDRLTSAPMFADYECKIIAVYFENGFTVDSTSLLVFPAITPKVGKFVIDAPDYIVERNSVTLKATVMWVRYDATQEQIDNEDPAVVLGWTVVSPKWTSTPTAIDGIPHIAFDIVDNVLTAVEVPQTVPAVVTATIITELGAVSTSKSIQVIDQLLDLTYIEGAVRQMLLPTEINTVQFFGNWNNGNTTELDAALYLEYVPSPSVIAEQEAQVDAWNEAGNLPAKTYADIDYNSLVTLALVDTDKEFVDPIKDPNTVVPRKGIVYGGEVGGTAVVRAEYVNPITGTTHIQTATTALVPRKYVATDMQLDFPPQVMENSRAVLRALVTYENGSQEYVVPTLTINHDGYDQYPLVIERSAVFSGYELLHILTGQYVNTVEQFIGVPIEIRMMREFINAPMTSDAVLADYLNDSQWPLAIIQTRQIDTDLVFQIKARYYSQTAELSCTLVNKPIAPRETIVSARVIGPAEFSATREYESFALMVTYAAPDIAPSAFEYAQSSDWRIENLSIDPDDPYTGEAYVVLTIDEDGYVRPQENVTATFDVVATYDDGFVTFERRFSSRMVRTNIFLDRLSIIGPSSVYDTLSANQLNGVYVDYDAANPGFWYVSYTAEVFYVDDLQGYPANPLTFELLSPVPEPGIVIGAVDGRLYVRDKVSYDVALTLKVTYTEIRDDIEEQVTALLPVTVYSERAIDSVTLIIPSYSFVPGPTFQLLAEYTRRTGYIGSSANPEAGVTFRWYIEAAEAGTVLDPVTGQIRFAPMTTAQYPVIGVEVTEGRNVLHYEVELTVHGVGYPESLTITGFQNIRDESQVQYLATLGRRSRPSEVITQNCLWTIRNAADREISIPGISISPTTGVLTVGNLDADTEFYIGAFYQEGDFRLNALYPVTARSSYPRYGTKLAGINTLPETAVLTDRHLSKTGGRITMLASADEYGYFMCRKDYGQPVFSAVRDNGIINTLYGGWDGAQWPANASNGLTGPIEFDITYDNITETWALYRTNERGWQSGTFSFFYQR